MYPVTAETITDEQIKQLGEHALEMDDGPLDETCCAARLSKDPERKARYRAECAEAWNAIVASGRPLLKCGDISHPNQPSLIDRAHEALNAANVAVVDDAGELQLRFLQLPERIAMLVSDRDEARKLADATARELAEVRLSNAPAKDAPTDPLDLARFTIEKYGAGADKPSVRLAAEVLRLTALINTPRTDDFFEAVRIEAAHQIERWGVEHDAGKRTEDWFTLCFHLLGKAARAHYANDREKLVHHIITVAAVALNWHRNMTGVSTAMRPGVGPTDDEAKAVRFLLDYASLSANQEIRVAGAYIARLLENR